MFEKLFGEVKGIFNIITIIELIISIMYILLGIIFFTNSEMSNFIVSNIMGVFLIVNGISSIFAYIKRGGIILFNNNLIYGIVLLVIGIVAMFLGNVLSIIIGIYLIVISVQKINFGIILKKFKESSWLITLVVGILYLAMAIIAFFTSNVVIEATGIILLGYGIINFINILLLRRRGKYFIA